MRIVLFLLLGIFLFSGCSRGKTLLPKVSRTEWLPFPACDSRMEVNRYELPLEKALHTIAIHHTASEQDSPLFYFQYHTRERGYADVGYHFMIQKDGTLYEGRDLNYRGAHVAGHNDGVIGIAVIGDFEHHEPSELQLRMLDRLIGELSKRYGIRTLGGHQDFLGAKTLCPGRFLEPYLSGWAEKYGLYRLEAVKKKKASK